MGLDPVCSSSKTKGTKVVFPETMRTFSAIFTQIIPRAHCDNSWILGGPELPNFQNVLHKDQNCSFMKVEGPKVSILQTSFPGLLWNT